jgi:hypothetical protein
MKPRSDSKHIDAFRHPCRVPFVGIVLHLKWTSSAGSGVKREQVKLHGCEQTGDILEKVRATATSVGDEALRMCVLTRTMKAMIGEIVRAEKNLELHFHNAGVATEEIECRAMIAIIHKVVN